MHREPVPEELLFSEAFKHEMDAYDILEKCSSSLIGMTFTVNNVVFFCRNIGIYEESHRLSRIAHSVVLDDAMISDKAVNWASFCVFNIFFCFQRDDLVNSILNNLLK